MIYCYIDICKYRRSAEMELEELKRRIAALEKELEDARERLPAHSIRPHQIMELEEMEEELARLKKELERFLSQADD